MNVIERMNAINAEQKIATFMAKEKENYDFKKRYAEIRVNEFISECDKRDLNCHVSVGGLDSITLFMFIRSLGYDVPGISASYLEDKSIQQIHRQLGIESVHPIKDKNGKVWTKQRVLQEFGFPVLSKELAGKIELLQNPSKNNKTVRHPVYTRGTVSDLGSSGLSG